MSPDSRLWVIDSILDPGARDDMSKAVDMLMVTVTEGGRERTQDGWERLDAANGLRIDSPNAAPAAHLDLVLAPD